MAAEAGRVDVSVAGAVPLLPGGASIVLIGSGAADKGDRGTTVYAASKAALRSFARTWTTDVKQRGARVNVLSPVPPVTEAGRLAVDPRMTPGDRTAHSAPLGT